MTVLNSLRATLFPLRSRIFLTPLTGPLGHQKLDLQRARLRPFHNSHFLQHASPKLKLRDYQQECIQSILENHEAGHSRLGVSLATGSGKTVIFSQLIDRVPARTNGGSQTLILAHRRELVEQAARHCQSLYPNRTIGIEMSANKDSGESDIVVASVQSITSGDRIHKFDPSRFKLVIVDEAHHITSSRYIQVLSHFGLDEPAELGTERPLLVGVSATFARHDGVALGQLVDKIVYHRDYLDMIHSQWLCGVRFTTVKFDLDLSNVKLGESGDYQAASLSRAVNTVQSNEVAVRSWLAKAQGRKSTIVFCADVAHIEGLTETFRQYGIDARYVTGNTPTRVRADRVDDFRAGKFPVLVNCGVFTEGTDISNIDCVLLARPTRSRTLLVQMIGRGMRLHPGKEDCLIIDLVSSLAEGIATTPTLFGLGATTDLDGASLSDVQQMDKADEDAASEPGDDKKAAEKQGGGSGSAGGPRDLEAAVKNVTFTEYDSVLDLVEDTRRDTVVALASANAWVNVGPARWVLPTKKGHITIEKDGEDGAAASAGEAEYAIKFTPALSAFVKSYRAMERREGKAKKSAPYGRTTEVGRAGDLDSALRAADTYAGEKMNRFEINRFSRWRRDGISEGQIKFLSQFYNKTARDIDAAETVKDKESGDGKEKKTGRFKKPLEQLTKGEAADRITRIMFGIKSHWTKVRREARKQERINQKTQKEESNAAWLKHGESLIKVGPLR